MTTAPKKIMVIRALQGDLPLVPEPYGELARAAGISEQEFLEAAREMKQDGTMRRLGAMLSHRKAGFVANGMSVWKVPEQRIDEIGPIAASFPEVSHCYARPTFPGWEYNLYAMIHARTREQCLEVARRISEWTGITDYRVLFSVREFKKVGMTYFTEEQ